MSKGMFKHAIAMFAAISAALALPLEDRDTAMGKIDAYRSRGKGRGTASKRYGNKPGKYMPHQGARECARRVEQRRGAP
jgi:hypothetical protein